MIATIITFTKSSIVYTNDPICCIRNCIARSCVYWVSIGMLRAIIVYNMYYHGKLIVNSQSNVYRSNSHCFICSIGLLHSWYQWNNFYYLYSHDSLFHVIIYIWYLIVLFQFSIVLVYADSHTEKIFAREYNISIIPLPNLSIRIFWTLSFWAQSL